MIDGVGLEPDVYVENEPEGKYKILEGVEKLRKVTKPSLNAQSEDVLNAEKIYRHWGMMLTLRTI